MGMPLIPDFFVESIFELTPERLNARGKRLVLADLDNTLARYREKDPSEAVLHWRRELEAAGIRVFILSNGRRPGRSRRFAEGLEVDFLSHAGKPGRAGFRQALERTGYPPEQALMVGDQIFTDVWGAHNAGITAVLVRPTALDSWFRRLRYGIETPFRRRYRNREGF